MEAARQFLPSERTHPHLVLCRVASEERLLAAADQLCRRGVRFALFREPDLGEQATALATEPIAPPGRAWFARFRCLSRDDLLAAPGGAAGL
jgi:hypothetical protein